MVLKEITKEESPKCSEYLENQYSPIIYAVTLKFYLLNLLKKMCFLIPNLTHAHCTNFKTEVRKKVKRSITRHLRKTSNMKHRNQNVKREKGTWRKWITAIMQGEENKNKQNKNYH